MKLRNKKTGIRGSIEYVMRTINPITGEPLLTVRYKDDTGITCYIDYETVAEFNENWEDAKQPLIKDEKIRNIVLDWALSYSETRNKEVKCIQCCGVTELVATSNCLARITLPSIPELLHLNDYTITELCGEEEE